MADLILALSSPLMVVWEGMSKIQPSGVTQYTSTGAMVRLKYRLCQVCMYYVIRNIYLKSRQPNRSTRESKYRIHLQYPSSSSLTLGPAYPPHLPACPCSQSSTLGRGLKLSLLALPAFLTPAPTPYPPLAFACVPDEKLLDDDPSVPEVTRPAEGTRPCPNA